MNKKNRKKRDHPLRDTVEVCPLCFSPVKRTPKVFDVNRLYTCTNTSCGWTGSFAVEVDLEEYKAFLSRNSRST